jgi:hypothetical protein
MVRRALPDLRFVADLVVSDGEYVAGRWTMTGTNTGTIDLFGLPPTGRPVTMTGQEVFRARGGLFVEVWHQEDLPGMLAQLGLQPPPPADAARRPPLRLALQARPTPLAHLSAAPDRRTRGNQLRAPARYEPPPPTRGASGACACQRGGTGAPRECRDNSCHAPGSTSEQQHETAYSSGSSSWARPRRPAPRSPAPPLSSPEFSPAVRVIRPVRGYCR